MRERREARPTTTNYYEDSAKHWHPQDDNQFEHDYTQNEVRVPKHAPETQTFSFGFSTKTQIENCPENE